LISLKGQRKEESLEVSFLVLLAQMHCSVNESTLIEKISQVLTSGLLSSKKEVKVGYGEDSGDDDSNTQDKNPHPSVKLAQLGSKREFFLNINYVHSLRFRVSL
jgi:hypothetical protein